MLFVSNAWHPEGKPSQYTECPQPAAFRHSVVSLLTQLKTPKRASGSPGAESAGSRGRVGPPPGHDSFQLDDGASSSVIFSICQVGCSRSLASVQPQSVLLEPQTFCIDQLHLIPNSLKNQKGNLPFVSWSSFTKKNLGTWQSMFLAAPLLKRETVARLLLPGLRLKATRYFTDRSFVGAFERHSLEPLRTGAWNP